MGGVHWVFHQAAQAGVRSSWGEDFRIYSEYERAGIETMRNLASLYEAKEDALAALHFTEMGLVYNGSDKDLLEMWRDCRHVIETANEFVMRLGTSKELLEMAWR